MIKIAWSEKYNHPLPAGHRFPMEKYDLIPQQLLYEGIIFKENLFIPEPMPEKVLLLTHSAEYLSRAKKGELSAKEMRKIGFPYSPELIEREKTIMFGTVQAALSALETGVAFNIAGGTHHAFYDRGEVFCIFNDIAIAANYLLAEKKVSRVLIVDLDVHQGNGTAALFAGREDIFTFSMHGRNNYPLHKETSSLDVELKDFTEDAEYLSLLSEILPSVISEFNPGFIFYQSGVDVLATDKLGRISLTLEGCRQRDLLVLQEARKRGIPLAAAMGGGYSPDIRDIIEAHCNLYRLAMQMY